MPGVSPNLSEKWRLKIVEKSSCICQGSGYNKSNMDRGAVHGRGVVWRSAAPERTNLDPALEGGIPE